MRCGGMRDVCEASITHCVCVCVCVCVCDECDATDGMDVMRCDTVRWDGMRDARAADAATRGVAGAIRTRVCIARVVLCVYNTYNIHCNECNGI